MEQHDKQKSVNDQENCFQGRNVWVSGRRTSVRLEPEMWQALQDVAKFEGVSVGDVCTSIEKLMINSRSFSSAVRVFLLMYFRDAHETALSALKLFRSVDALNATNKNAKNKIDAYTKTVQERA